MISLRERLRRRRIRKAKNELSQLASVRSRLKSYIEQAEPESAEAIKATRLYESNLRRHNETCVRLYHLTNGGS